MDRGDGVAAGLSRGRRALKAGQDYRPKAASGTIPAFACFFNMFVIELFQAFVAEMKARFSRLAGATRKQKDIGDLHNDAIVFALEIGERRGRPVDFSDPVDRDLVMRHLYLENVKRGDWKMRYAARIDHAPDGNEESQTLGERLPAAASSDPLVSLLLSESAVEAEAMLAASYSQASAYVITFRNFHYDRQRICSHLILSESGLNRRLSFARETVKVQPSMFDRIERVDPNFMPMPGKAYITTDAETQIPGDTQHTLAF